MTQETKKLQRILDVRLKFMRIDWAFAQVEVLKTKIRVTFATEPYLKGERTVQDSRTTEYQLTPRFDINNVIEDQQRKLLRDIKGFVGGNEAMDEVLEVMVG